MSEEEVSWDQGEGSESMEDGAFVPEVSDDAVSEASDVFDGAKAQVMADAEALQGQFQHNRTRKLLLDSESESEEVLSSDVGEVSE
ncbi:hypothetical protein KIPB_012262, partial [Kipferlia bialata]|eukprot:g12262.t1